MLLNPSSRVFLSISLAAMSALSLSTCACSFIVFFLLVLHGPPPLFWIVKISSIVFHPLT